MNKTRILLTLLLLAPLGACQSMRLSFLRFGSTDQKELLIDEVRDTRATQVETREDFASAFDVFRELIDADADRLEDLYVDLQEDLHDCKRDLEDLRDHMGTIEDEATELFAEWTVELQRFSNPKVRDKSQAMLADTRERYEKLMGALSRCEEGIEPVSSGFQDYVLFFNHNLNPRAIATLADTYPAFLEEVAALRAVVGSSLRETDSFLVNVEGRAPPHPAKAPKGGRDKSG